MGLCLYISHVLRVFYTQSLSVETIMEFALSIIIQNNEMMNCGLNHGHKSAFQIPNSSYIWIHTNLSYYKNEKYIQQGLEYQTFKFRIHSNSERFKVRFLNGQTFKMAALSQVVLYLRNFFFKTVQTNSHSKFEQDGAILFGFRMV